MNALLLSCLFVFSLLGMEQEKETVPLATEPEKTEPKKIGAVTFLPYTVEPLFLHIEDPIIRMKKQTHIEELTNKFLSFVYKKGGLEEISSKKSSKLIEYIFAHRPVVSIIGKETTTNKSGLVYLKNTQSDKLEIGDITVEIVGKKIQITKWMEDKKTKTKTQQQFRPTIIDSSSLPTCFSFHTQGSLLVGFENGTVALFDTEKMETIKQFSCPGGAIDALSFFNNSSSIFLTKSKKTKEVSIWNTKENIPYLSLENLDVGKDYISTNNEIIRSHAVKSSLMSSFDRDKRYKVPVLWASHDGYKAWSLPQALFIYTLSQTVWTPFSAESKKIDLLKALSSCPLLETFEPAIKKSLKLYLNGQVTEKK